MMTHSVIISAGICCERTSQQLSACKLHELIIGTIHYSDGDDGCYAGYGNGFGTNLVDFISDEMRADWEENREMLLQLWAEGATETPLPWAAYQFGGAALKQQAHARRRFWDNMASGSAPG